MQASRQIYPRYWYYYYG